MEECRTIENHSSRPHHIHHLLSKLEERILVSIRRHLRIPVNECVQLLTPYLSHLRAVTAYRILARYGLSILPHPFRSVGRFPQYLPGFFHMDLAYLPILGGRITRNYLLVAIDRTTKLLFLMIVPGKHQDHTIRFLKVLTSWCPYRIHHLLTDNGREFGRRFSEVCAHLYKSSTYATLGSCGSFG